MIELYPFQETCVGGLRNAFRLGFRSPLLVSPTGSGKTVMFSYLTGRLIAARQQVGILVHRDELVDQVSATLGRFDVSHGLVTAGGLYDNRELAHVMSVFSVARRVERVKVPDYVITDEAHHCIPTSTWGKLIAAWRERNPNLRVIGVTATPKRLSGEGLGSMFDFMVLGPSTRELIDQGVLSDYRLFAPAPDRAVDLSGVGIQAGDYKRDASAAVMAKAAIVGDTIAEYRRLLDGAPTVSFEVSVENAQDMAEQFRAAGYRAVCLDGKMDRKLRREVVRDFGRGQINVMTSCELVSEGFDVPGIQGAILRRPTWSLAMYLQQVGRTLRTAPGKTHAYLLDQVGNSNRHGLPDDPRGWSLLDRKRKAKPGDDAPACRQCPSCYAVSPAAAVLCRECGCVFPRKPRVIDEVDGKLAEVAVERARRQAQADQATAKTLDDLIALGKSRGFKNPAGWARHVYQARQARSR